MKKRTPSKVISARIYSTRDISRLFHVHVRTVQRWYKLGLKTEDDNTRSRLVSGKDLKNFIEKQQNRHKHSLKPGEFFCLKCRQARRSLPENSTNTRTGKQVGKNSEQIIIHGICEKCGSRLCRFTTDTKEQRYGK